MKKSVMIILMLLTGLVFNETVRAQGLGLGTAFTFQGKLSEAGSPADGLYDFGFRLHSDPNVATGTQVGPTAIKDNVMVAGGTFSVALDFGNVFDGTAYWLQIGVRPGKLTDPNAFTVLNPPQKLTPAPYALYAKTANSVTGGIGIDGSGTPNYLPKFVTANTLGDSVFYESGGNIGVAGKIMASAYASNSPWVAEAPVGTVRAFIDDTTGFFGIGTISPADQLHVMGNINVKLDSGYEIGGNTVLSNPGTKNIFVGVGAGQNNTTGEKNSFLGYNAGAANTVGYNNTFIGHAAGYANTEGFKNIFLGGLTGLNNTTGSYNTFLGKSSGYNNTEGDYNTFAGRESGFNNNTGDYNTFLGHHTGYANTTGFRNTFLGADAGASSTDGWGNTFLGYEAGESNTTGDTNTFLGHQAGWDNDTGSQNTFLGVSAGYYNTSGKFNTLVGEHANNKTGLHNTFMGHNAGSSNNSGDENTGVGGAVGSSNTVGQRNVFIGYEAGTANTSGSSNTFMGKAAGRGNTTGYNNVYVGSFAGSSNLTGNSNVFIGSLAGSNETGSNKLYIDNSNTSTPLIYGDFSSNRVGLSRVPTANALEVNGSASKSTAGSWLSNSDGRIKTEVQTIGDGLEKLSQVRLVNFKYSPEYRRQHTGIEDRKYMNVIAQEFREVFPGYVKSSGEKLSNGDNILQVDTYPLTIYTAAAVQDLYKIVKEKDAEILELKERISKMEYMMAELTRQQEGDI